MKFKRITDKNALNIDGRIDSMEKFYKLVHDYEIVGLAEYSPERLSSSYFFRLIHEGSSVRARSHVNGFYKTRDDCSSELQDFYLPLLDHGALWKTKSGSVICTAMPYGDRQSIEEAFRKLLQTYDYSEPLSMKFLSDEYHYRNNGSFMIMIFDSTCD